MNPDTITLAAFTLVPGATLLIIAFIITIKTGWSDLNSVNCTDKVGFGGWFWQLFRWWIFTFMIVGILLILTFYAFVTK